MAPEMFKSVGYDAEKSDIWAMGVILFIMLTGFPPFHKPNLSDWWLHKLANNKHALFWQAHSRQMYFAENTKDLINKILATDPSKRISIADIKRHPWFNGPTVSQSVLVAELTRRRDIVEASKEREKQEALAKQQVLEAVQIGGIVARGMDDDNVDDDVLPPCPPSFRFFNAAPAQDVPSAGADRDFDLDKKHETTETEPLPYDSKTALACYTSFHSNTDPNSIIERLTSILESSRFQYAQNKAEYAVKANCITGAGKVRMKAQVLAYNQGGAKYIVQFRRRYGDSAHFRKLYQNICDNFADMIVIPK
jgi:serine/threonine protein kinase